MAWEQVLLDALEPGQRFFLRGESVAVQPGVFTDQDAHFFAVDHLRPGGKRNVNLALCDAGPLAKEKVFGREIWRLETGEINDVTSSFLICCSRAKAMAEVINWAASCRETSPVGQKTA